MQPIHFACVNGHTEVIKHLVRTHNADPNAARNDGKNCKFFVEVVSKDKACGAALAKLIDEQNMATLEN